MIATLPNGSIREEAPVDEDEDDTTVYAVVVNDEEQYSIWPAHKPLPLGWTAAGVTGPKAVCLDHIEAIWTDMRPLSVRRAMEAEDRAEAQRGGNGTQ